MNDTPELPPTTDVDTATPAAKPVRRKRAVAAVEAVAAVADEAPAAVDDTGDTAAEVPVAAAKPARRRRSVAVQEATEVTPEAVADAAPVAPSAAVEAPAAAPLPETEPRTHLASEPGDAGQGGDLQDGEPQDGAAPSEDAGADGPRSRRRNRRDRKRGERGEPREGEVSGAAPGNADETRAPALPKVESGQLFAQVLSGEFDDSVEAPAEGEAVEATEGGEEAAAHKRILQPDADAPKLQKVLAQAGVGSRRDMEELILEGLITVNDQPAHIGQRISFGDRVMVRGKPVRYRITPPPPRIIAYHKPVGEVVTHDDPEHRPTVFRRLPRLQQGKWMSVGRLDINTEGLLLFTTSGELANQLMHPRFGVEREYAVRVLGTLSAEDKAQLLEGVNIDGQTASFRSIEEGGGEGANRWYRVVITEGRNREVRKLFDSVELTVSRLIRIRYGTVVLPLGLKRGVWVDLEDADVRAIRRLASGGDAQRDAPREARPANRPNPNERAAGQGQGQPRGDRPDRGERQPPRQSDRQNDRQNDRPRGNGPRPAPSEAQPTSHVAMEPRRAERELDPELAELDIDPSQIPNPLEQTFDKRFVQNPRSPAGGRGFRQGGGGFGAGGSAPAPAGPKKGGAAGPREPDPLQTSIGYLGADAFHRKGNKGGGRGGNRGGSGGGFGGGGGGGAGGGNRSGGFGGGGGGGGGNAGGGGGGRRGR